MFLEQWKGQLKYKSEVILKMKKLYFLDENSNLVLAPEVKWSDNVKFAPTNSLADTDYIMGLSDGVNVKYILNLNIDSDGNIDTPGGVTMGGNLIFPNKATTLKFLCAEGSDVTIGGTYQLPYETLSYSLSQITDASTSNQYGHAVLGALNDDAEILLKPNVSIFGLNSYSYINSSDSIGVDSSWNSAGYFDGSTYSFLTLNTQVNLDYSSLSTAAGFTTWVQDFFYSVLPFTYNGSPSGGSQLMIYGCYMGSHFVADNGYSYSNSTQFQEGATIGAGVTTAGHSLYSFSDWYITGILSLSSQSTFSSQAKIFGALIESDSFSINVTNSSNTIYTVFVHGSRIDSNLTLTADNTVSTGTSDIYISGCNPIPSLEWNDQSIPGKNITLNIDRGSYPSELIVTNGTPTIKFESNLRKITGLGVNIGVDMQPNQTYLLRNSTPITLTLPSYAQELDYIEIVMYTSGSAGGFTIAQHASEQIVYGTTGSTVGSGHGINSLAGSGNTNLKLTYMGMFFGNRTWAINYTSAPVNFF